jgi:hypothetical protein
MLYDSYPLRDHAAKQVYIAPATLLRGTQNLHQSYINIMQSIIGHTKGNYCQA